MNDFFAQPAGAPVQVDGRSLRAGVLTNPRSGANKKGGGRIRNLLAGWPEVLHRETSTPQGVASALEDFARDGVELVIINGGDGTVQAALTALGNRRVFSRPPLFALLCAGTTSMLPRDVGIAGKPAAALERVLTWAKAADASLVLRPRSILRVQRGTGPALYGMFFGAGAICQGIRLFHSKDNPMGWRGQLMPTVTMLRLLLAILLGRPGQVPPFTTRTALDGRAAQPRSDTFVLVSTLERLFLGMRPYWGEEDGPLRYTAVTARPRRLLRVLASLFCAQRSRHAIPANGYDSHNAAEVQLHMQGDFTLDGELYAAGEGPVTVTPAGPALFLCSR